MWKKSRFFGGSVAMAYALTAIYQYFNYSAKTTAKFMAKYDEINQVKNKIMNNINMDEQERSLTKDLEIKNKFNQDDISMYLRCKSKDTISAHVLFSIESVKHGLFFPYYMWKNYKKL